MLIREEGYKVQNILDTDVALDNIYLEYSTQKPGSLDLEILFKFTIRAA